MIKIVAVALAIVLWAVAQTKPDFTGVWEVNNSKSHTAQGGPQNTKVKVERQDSTYKLTFRDVRNGETNQFAMNLIVGQDSKFDLSGVTVTAHTEWEGAVLSIRTDAAFGDRKLHSTERWSVSPDGNTITVDGIRQVTGVPDQATTLVYDRIPANSWGPDEPPKMAEAVYKNIQIMKGVPAPQLRTTMVNLTKWLGVDCSHCHVTGSFEKDDLPAKQTARKMFTMVRGIGKDYFGGPSPVTCWTCHRGQAKPQFLPPQ